MNGVARVGRVTPRLLKRVRPGDVVVLDQIDLDAATAEQLVSRGVSAVVNASPSTSGRYPNLGPAVLVEAGVALLDDVGPDVFRAVADGEQVRLEGGTVVVRDLVVARGQVQDFATIAASAEHARAGLAAQLTDLTANATGLLLDERELLLEGVGVPSLATDLTGRHVVVVTGSYDGDLRDLRGYRRERRPVLVGVDGGADLLLDQGLVPEVVVGDPQLMSDKAVRRARDVVVRLDAPGRSRLEALGVHAVSFRTQAPSEDMALLLVAAQEPALVVTAGLPLSVGHLLDLGRSGGASALLTRLHVGERLVSPVAAAELVPDRPVWPALLLLLVAVGALVLTALTVTPHGFDLGLLHLRWDALVDRLPDWARW
ncbi:MAG: thiamine pyrophosphokinae catalytic protein [Frankiales bacterium]|nr:thiamine pyrophosphokinae catalytic protein [Frankiales bacterium]